jgi:ribonuclease P protein component
MLSIKNRLSTPTEFYQVKKFGKKLSSSLFNILFIIDSKNPEPKFGVVISKKFAPKATDRNKVKRLTRSLLRENLNNFPTGVKALVFPKSKIIESNYTDLIHNFQNLVKEIK